MKKFLFVFVLFFLFFWPVDRARAVCPCQEPDDSFSQEDWAIEDGQSWPGWEELEAEDNQAQVLDQNESDEEDFRDSQEQDGLYLYSGANSSVSKNNFFVLEKIFLRFQSLNAGTQKNELKILNSSHEQIALYRLRQAGGRPFTYTASFLAPEPPGTYYLDIRLEDETGLFVGQQNFEVVSGSGENPFTVAGQSGQPADDQVSEGQKAVSQPSPPVVSGGRGQSSSGLVLLVRGLIGGIIQSILATFRSF